MLPIHVGKKLLVLVQQNRLPASMCRHVVFNEMVHDGILQKQMLGRGKAYYVLPSIPTLNSYLQNRFGIANLHDFVTKLEDEQTTKTEAIQVASNSKSKKIRSFTGFLVATLTPVDATLCDQPFTISPAQGAFTYVSDFQNFTIPNNITVVGIENAANFNSLRQQADLFANLQALFVCRYPHSSDLIKWLQLIPNNYLHFGDIDFAGIHIYLNEYYKVLGDRASFFVPPATEELLPVYGNRALYNNHLPVKLADTHGQYQQLQPLIDFIHAHKKGLEQEIFIDG